MYEVNWLHRISAIRRKPTLKHLTSTISFSRCVRKTYLFFSNVFVAIEGMALSFWGVNRFVFPKAICVRSGFLNENTYTKMGAFVM